LWTGIFKVTSVCILDYGSGNVKSVFNLISVVEPKTVVSNDSKVIEDASHIVLPGVGAFGAAMRRMRDALPLGVLEQVVLEKKRPFLGICVGMQVLADYGTEFGRHEGLGWISGSVNRLEAAGLRLPHIGWNNIAPAQEHPLLTGFEADPDFYYVHSFAFKPANPANLLATSEYGSPFAAGVCRENILGVQFHPEKSQQAGQRLIRNFLALS
jgi:imidazole glycerol-phosphate synthase subunit HisH